jgi:hypothetical protein
MAVAPTGSGQHVPVSANSAPTYAQQRAGILSLGVASGIFDRLIYDANMKLRQRSDRFILCTQSMADALARDIKRSNVGSDLQFDSLFGGLVHATVYNGEKILALPKWDEMIRLFNDTGTAWFAPHRAVFATKSNLLAGTDGNAFLSDLEIWFNRETRMVPIYGRCNLGTMVWEDDLVQFAY